MANLEINASFRLEKIRKRTRQLLNYSLNNREPKKLLELHNAMKYASIGGKHLRSALCFALSLDLAQSDDLADLSHLNNHSFPKAKLNPVDATALSLELVHSYSLVHDDLPSMDNDDTRRGKPSVHIKFNETTAILVGDSLQSLAFEVLCYAGLNTNQLTSALSLLSKAIGSVGMAGGQMLDMNSKNLTSAKVIKKMYQLKTGKLFEAALLLPYSLHFYQTKPKNKIMEASQDYKLLKKMGSNLGLLFQIQDDLLESDNVLNCSKLGKPSDSDIRNKKNTLAKFIDPLKLEKMQVNLAKRIEKIERQISFEIKNLNSLISQIRQRDY